MSESAHATRGRSARTVIVVLGGSAMEKVRVNVKGALLESGKVEGAESVAVILGGVGRDGRVVKIISLSPTSVQGILVGDGVGISPADHSSGPEDDRASNDFSLADGQCVMESV